jgi:hypothetical protein
MRAAEYLLVNFCATRAANLVGFFNDHYGIDKSCKVESWKKTSHAKCNHGKN